MKKMMVTIEIPMPDETGTDDALMLAAHLDRIALTHSPRISVGAPRIYGQISQIMLDDLDLGRYLPDLETG